jgi:ribonuclease R
MVFEKIQITGKKGLKYDQLLKLEITTQNLDNLLDQLVRDNKICFFKETYYPVQLKVNVGIGQIRINKSGNGFVTLNQIDYFVHKKNIGLALAGDLVVFEIFESKFGKEGRVNHVNKRDISTMIVRTVQNGNYIDYIPLNKGINFHIRVEPKQKNMKPNQMLKLKVIDVNPKTKKLICSLVSKIGDLDLPGVDILAVLEKNDVNVDFSPETVEQANLVSEKISEKQLENRTDLRELTTFTIDGADSKDLDDAISIKLNSDGSIKLYVHIANVTHYVKDNTPLDIDAFNRGTSIYLVDRVVPMLPAKLSNGICSLNPNQDRLTLTCEIDVDINGKTLSHSIYPSVINSDYRLTYDECNDYFNNNENLSESVKSLSEQLNISRDLKRILSTTRRLKGTLEFEIPEIKIIVDKDGKAVDVKRRERDFAEQLIEEFMVLANETVAKHLYDLEVPAVYRIHETPNPEKVRLLNSVITKYGISIKDVNDVTPLDYQKVVNHFKGNAIENVIGMLILRSLEKAKYVDYNEIHFGLASDYYTHFTSPIRRYPDLIVHRILEEFVFKKQSEQVQEKYKLKLPSICEHATKMEKVALDCEREVLDIKKAEYMEDKVNQVFDGVIVSVNSFGFFVQLPNLVEGLVHVSTLKDEKYIFDKDLLQFVGESTHKKYTLGQNIRVKVIKADKLNKAVDFEVLYETK